MNEIVMLEKLADSDELRQLEDLLSEFNIFEALGAVRQELRHSDFLAFLLDPHQSHRLSDTFMRQFLTTAFADSEDNFFGGQPLEDVGLQDTTIRREWHRMDILIHNEAERFVCVAGPHRPGRQPGHAPGQHHQKTQRLGQRLALPPGRHPAHLLGGTGE